MGSDKSATPGVRIRGTLLSAFVRSRRGKCRMVLALAAFVSGAQIRAQKPVNIDPVVVDGPREQTIQGALRFLSSQQQASGAWTGGEGRRSDQPVAITG